MANASPKRRPWRPRFKLRTFLIVFTLFSLWLGWRVAVVERTERAIARLESAGCLLAYPPQVSESPTAGRQRIDSYRVFGWSPTARFHNRKEPSYVSRLVFGYQLGDLPDIVWIGAPKDFSEEGASRSVDKPSLNTLIENVTKLPTVTQIELNGTSISGTSLRLLATQADLCTLSLVGTDVGDENTDDLAMLTHLQSLELIETQFTESGLQELRGRLPNCAIVDTEEIQLFIGESRETSTPASPTGRLDLLNTPYSGSPMPGE